MAFGIGAPVFGTAATNSTAGTTNSPGIPAGLTNGVSVMLMFQAIAADKTGTINTPAGWTKLGASANGTSETLAVYWKLYATGDAAPSVTWTTNAKNTGRIGSWPGLDSTTPNDVAISFATGSSATPTSPTVTAVTMGACRLHISAQQSAGTHTPSVLMVERIDQATSTSSAASLCVNEQNGMASDAAGTRADTSSVNAAWVAATLWLRPATPSTFGLLRSVQTQSAGVASVAGTLASADVANSPSGTAILAAVINGTGGVSAADVSGVSYPSNAFTLARNRDTLATYEGSIWYKANATVAGAATTVTATRGSGTGDMTLWVGEVKGLDTSSPYDTSGSGQSAATTVVATTDAALASGTELCIDVVGDDGTAPTFDTNYVALCAQANSAQSTLFAAMRELSGGSTETNTFTTSGVTGNNVNVLAAFKNTSAVVDPFPLLPGHGISPLYRM